MEKKEYLNEESYQKAKSKIVILAVIVLLVGITIGSLLIAKGISNSKNVNSTYSEDSKQNKINDLTNKLNSEKANLETKKSELQAKGITASSNYENGEAYDLYLIKNVLNPSFSYCSFDEYKNNTLTSKYCSLKSELEDVKDTDVEFERDFNGYSSIPFYMIGGFIIISSAMIALSIYTFAKRREIVSFTAQQVMPVAKEGIDKMAPTVGNAAKEIAKGIKEGINDADKK